MTILTNELQNINGGTVPTFGLVAAVEAYLDMLTDLENIHQPVTCNHGSGQ